MFVVFYGSDRGGVRDGATKFIETKMPLNGLLTTIEVNDFEIGRLANALGANSLFGESEWFVLDTPSTNVDFLEEVNNSLAEMAQSDNTFVILEDALLSLAKKKYEKHASAITEFSAKKNERLNTFAMAEALAGKDKRKLWVLLQEARLNGLRDEEVIGMLWWQLKSLRLASLTNSADEAGMKDFPYNKAKRALVKFSDGEISRLSQSLLEVYHDGHAGLRDIDLALEEWVLKL
ncbi:hypothetical protein KC865_00930 [Candidatus Kaiserbacteria bacterium]|nr:hypothetical protein [Candidatus Kaiserbacteria bacterium]USN92579.1 MAG: hypothetical protein H6782_02055 [Candidatus Nomurabacteria bacterium]